MQARLGVQGDSSEFPIVRLPIAPAVSTAVSGKQGSAWYTVSLCTASSLIMNVSPALWIDQNPKYWKRDKQIIILESEISVVCH